MCTAIMGFGTSHLAHKMGLKSPRLHRKPSSSSSTSSSSSAASASLRNKPSPESLRAPLCTGPEPTRGMLLIGKGAFSEVFLDENSGRAIKRFRDLKLCPRARAYAAREREILERIRHPFIIGYHGVYERDNRLHMSLDYAAGRDLADQLAEMGSLPERVVRLYAAEMALAVGHLHKLGICHRDIKPENILLDAEGHIKMADFGLSSRLASSKLQGLRTVCGTPPYAAPEVFLQGDSSRGYGNCCDWWSLGVLVLELLSGSLPWGVPCTLVQMRQLYMGPMDFQVPQFVSDMAGSFLKDLLEPRPGCRLGSLSSEEVTGHCFFRGGNPICWKKLEMGGVQSPFVPPPRMSAEGGGCALPSPSARVFHVATAPSTPSALSDRQQLGSLHKF